MSRRISNSGYQKEVIERIRRRSGVASKGACTTRNPRSRKTVPIGSNKRCKDPSKVRRG